MEQSPPRPTWLPPLDGECWGEGGSGRAAAEAKAAHDSAIKKTREVKEMVADPHQSRRQKATAVEVTG